MQLCNDGHEEVAFASIWAADCPACVYAEEIRSALREEIEALREELDSHECE